MSEESDAPSEAKEPEPAKGSKRWSLTATLAIAASVIAVGAGGVGLLFKVDPAAQPCIGGASAHFIDAPVFPESQKEYGYISHHQKLYAQHPRYLGADVRATVEVDNLRGKEVELYYTLLTAGARGAADRVVSGADEFGTSTQVVSSCTWRGGFDTFVEPQVTPTDLNPTGLDPKESYRIVLELFEGQREGDGRNRIGLFETPVFRG